MSKPKSNVLISNDSLVSYSKIKRESIQPELLNEISKMYAKSNMVKFDKENNIEIRTCDNIILVVDMESNAFPFIENLKTIQEYNKEVKK